MLKNYLGILSLTAALHLQTVTFGLCKLRLSIQSGCGNNSAECIEFILKDHRGNRLGYDAKTLKTVYVIEGGQSRGSYGLDWITSLDTTEDRAIKVLELDDPTPGLYTLNVIGISTRVYSISFQITVRGYSEPVVDKVFYGIIDKDQIHTFTFPIPMDATDKILIEKKVDLQMLRQGILVAGENRLINQDLANFLKENIKNAIKLQKKSQKEKVKSVLECMGQQLHSSVQEIEKSRWHAVSAAEALEDDVSILFNSVN